MWPIGHLNKIHCLLFDFFQVVLSVGMISLNVKITSVYLPISTVMVSTIVGMDLMKRPVSF